MEASDATQFNPTFFEIYDKSDASCNRLIVVQPFQWHIWGINGQVYLLNESNRSCPINYTPTIVVPNNKSDDLSNQVFKDVCINKVFNEVVRSYTDSIKPVIVNFNIRELQQDETKFTILDALNFLFTKYLTMDPPHTYTDNLIVERSMVNREHLHNLKLKDFPPLFTHHVVPHHVKQKLQRVLQKKRTKDPVADSDSVV